MELVLSPATIKSWIKQTYHKLQQIPLMGFLVRYSGDMINLPRKSRITLTQLEQCQYQVYQLTQKINQLAQKVETINTDVSRDTIKQLLEKTVFYQPLYGYIKLDQKEPQRPCLDRADAMNAFLSSMGPTRLLDVGCSFGYFSYYLAERGYIVDAIDSDPNCINICNFLAQFNAKNSPNIANATFDLNYIKTIPVEKFDIVLLLSVLHHITSEKGVPYVQEMMQALLERVPMLVVELALCEEDVPFPWKDRLPANELEIFATCKDIEIVKLGCFSTHLSTIKRPLYMVSKKSISINDRQYDILKRRFIAHEDAHHYFRVFYEAKDAFIKNYRLLTDHGSFDASKAEMLNEISIYQQLPSNNKLFPNFIDQMVDDTSIKLVLSKLPGSTLKYHLENNTVGLNSVSIVRQILEAVKLLRDKGYYHNDIRSWNVMVDLESDKAYLFDLGRAEKEERESTTLALLWIIYQLNQKKSVNYLKVSYPLTKPPHFKAEQLEPELRQIAEKLQAVHSIDEYFAQV